MLSSAWHAAGFERESSLAADSSRLFGARTDVAEPVNPPVGFSGAVVDLPIEIRHARRTARAFGGPARAGSGSA